MPAAGEVQKNWTPETLKIRIAAARTILELSRHLRIPYSCAWLFSGKGIVQIAEPRKKLDIMKKLAILALVASVAACATLTEDAPRRVLF